MNIDEYRQIYNELNTYDDIERLSKDYDKELLLVVYTEKNVRDVKRGYYKIKKMSKKLLNEWNQGESFTNLAHARRFSPMMMAQILLQERGHTKKDIKNLLRDYREAHEKRLKHELREASEKDIVYSDIGANIQYKRGQDGEARIRKWLQAKKWEFKEEEDLKGNTEFGGKTVDFLLDKPIEVQFGTEPEEFRKVYWIESKGSFGDEKKMQRDYEKQLKAYNELWGPGIVVYWFGYLDGMEMWLEARDVMLVDKDFFIS